MLSTILAQTEPTVTYLNDGVDFGDVILALVKVVVAFAILMVSVMLMVWLERKAISRLQNRIGPNVAGPFGLLQTLADGIKLFFKEDIIPTKADRYMFQLAPYLSLVPAFLAFSIIPIAGNFSGGHDGSSTIGGRTFLWQISDPPVGVLLFLAMSSIAVYGIMLAGWSSGSKYPLLASVRASAQAISYEAALGLSIAAVLLVSRSLSTHDIVVGQASSVVNWNLVSTGVIPFIVFIIAGTAELNRPPFDFVEAEQELVGGFHTEYSSIRFALFFLAEYMNTVTMGALIVTLFFGGPAPLVDGWVIGPLGAFNGFLWFFAKTFVFLFMFVWIRGTLPRLRYDQLMNLGWKVLIPISLAWLLLLAGIRSAQAGVYGWTDDPNVDTVIFIVVGLAVISVGYAVLRAAITNARTDRLTEAGLTSVPMQQTLTPVSQEDHH